MKKILDNKFVFGGIILVVGIILGWIIFGESKDAHSTHDHDAEIAKATIWTCSMHPQIRKNEPGDCPICGMDLIPLESDAGSIDPMAVSMSPTAMMLADIQTVKVQKGNIKKEIRLNGKVEADERNVSTQTSHIAGRIEQLPVNYTGEYVRKGQVIAYIYSPELVLAQKELFEAYKIMDVQPALYTAARGKLKNWKLTSDQIDNIIETGTPINSFPILSDLNGVVIAKKVNLGDYIMEGSALFDIVDFSRVWVMFDVYESDVVWIKTGAEISFTVQSYPGEEFKGKISYIDPVIDPKTRVAKARVEMTNNRQKLKPEMFVSGIVEEKLKQYPDALVVPKSAVMWTGERSVVYVKSGQEDAFNFVMRSVKLGPALGEGFIVEEGLEESEEIVVNGTFSIDAAAQLAGKPSMMNPEGGTVMTGHRHGEMTQESQTQSSLSIDKATQKSLEPVYQSYLAMKDALAKDDFNDAQKAGSKLKSALQKVPMEQFKNKSHQFWMDQSGLMNKALEHLDHFKDIEELRTAFFQLSKVMVNITNTFNPYSKTLYLQHCPMANSDKGADWLSLDDSIINPYFGAAMLGCGEVKKKF
ncbi:efflux RND transporter periplasmic adaptor subunit [Flexithrix dorotheae]|uniref:efflux RND transporter periplasmic adaptor subunit n=1 Tax=Flexithrix dorotheae TaxID=70993 RepID=UPI00036DF03B|nr:efflux RND transporter periplasmic adaptor subunit [Flexithrix dorotheae]